jgi:hypothetical protein
VEDEIDRIDAPQFPGADKFADAAHALGEAIREVDAEEPVCRARGVHDRLRLRGRPPQRFLAEDRRAALKRPDRLLGVHGARRRDHHPVDAGREQVVESRDELRVWRQPPRLCRHSRR